MTGHVPAEKFDLAAIRRARAASQLTGEDIAGLLRWMQDPNWPVALPAAEVLATQGAALITPLKTALASGDREWIWSLETHLIPKLAEDLRNSLKNMPASSIDREISSGGAAAGDGGQTAPLPDLGAWADLPFFKEDWPRIETVLADETRTILPPRTQRFAALKRTQPQDTRVVILGQDPYPTAGHANGLAFSVTPETPLPRSLKNIFRELEDDLGTHPANGDLSHWADQGVLLLNTALTVPEGAAGGHAKLGWTRLVQQVLARLDPHPRALVLWGKHAQKTAGNLSAHHLKIETAHPSPLSASRGFFGSRPFSRVNTWLTERGEPPITWGRRPEK